MYYIVYALLYLISLLPLKILYLLSDFFYLIVYYILGYRKKVVMNNLTISFPTKTEEEKITIAKKFYRNFTDTVIETIKLLSASDKFIKAHLIGNFSIFEEIRRKGKKCQAHLGHNFNWELANLSVALATPYQPSNGAVDLLAAIDCARDYDGFASCNHDALDATRSEITFIWLK